MTSNCKSCGVPIPDGQNFCSMCYGDPDYGRDGYLRRMMEQAALRAAEERAAWDNCAEEAAKGEE